MSEVGLLELAVKESHSDEPRMVLSDWYEDAGDMVAASAWRDSPVRLDTLPPHIAKLLPAIRDHFLATGLATGPCDHDAAWEAAGDAYAVAGLPRPRTQIWLPSPLQGAIGASMLTQVGDQVRAQVVDQVWDQVVDQVRAQVRDQVRDQVWDQVWAQVRAQVVDQVWAQVWGQVRAQVGDQVYRCGYGQHDAAWLSYYAAFDMAGLTSCHRLRPLVRLAANCGWWWPFKDSVIFTERPETLVMSGGRLVLIRYSDGFEVKK